MFPGQGSQHTGMGKQLYDSNAIAREVFEEAGDVLGFDMKKMCFEESLEVLTRTENTQPALLTVGWASFRIYMQEFGVKPLFAAGHSLGEITALTCAGAIAFADALKIVRMRGKFMQEAVPPGEGIMAAVSGVNTELIEKECRKISCDGNVAVISNYNSTVQTVISGHKEAVTVVSENLTAMGARVIPLKVSAPFHSPLMGKAAENLKAELAKYSFSDFRFPVISNVTALPYTNKEEIAEMLTLQIVNPVQWQATMEYLKNKDVESVVETGPKTVLRDLMKKSFPEIKSYSMDKDEDWQMLKSVMKENGDMALKNSDFKHSVVTKCIAVAVCTRNRNWDEQEYQNGVVIPYRKLVQMQEGLEKDNKEPAVEQMKEALDMLKTVFVTKKVSKKEQDERFNEILDETGTRDILGEFMESLEY